ncbi:uncharacterized protein Z520_11430 [Fonsecaea multimorphosa CBS 102226]|uniref:Major facilitator superfamily (MFS) profile domain-containing protein n=1 Tax=Fonsecaea multimorphosa CBS 102226 TaxID=1442371 RepID=A0A0D2JHU6_9EURO|nr:uncharacterized protein Z520_11430 [Fonsecaea multimorphosa CBS 102226]KIX92767.1 hypothetical protein Z520_11430 [Fonsecaea multimorphosa CBS 102226]OAL18017.1 hypothetical protein AYO22_11033 [Fonsecaea multimorphosa]
MSKLDEIVTLDEAPRVGAGVETYPARHNAEEKKVLRKLDWRVVPLIGLCYFLSFLDRSNIGNAAIAGMNEDLDLDTKGRYPWLLTIFYIGYLVAQVGVLGWKIFPPHIWAAVTMLIWGIVATCQAAATSWAGMMVLRLLLGISEAAFTPGMPYFLSFFYLRKELGFRCGLFLSCAPLANCFTGALAYGITSGNPALASWRLLFLAEGLPTVVFSFFIFFLLPDSPVEAKFLNEQEKNVARARLNLQVGNISAEDRRGKLKTEDTVAALLDFKSWIAALMYFSTNVSYSSLPVFLPIILKEMGFTAIHAQGLSAPPYFFSFLLTIASTYIADRTLQRGYTIMACSLMSAVGYTIQAATHQTAARYFGVFLCAGGLFPTIANILPWVLNNQGSDDRRGVSFVLLCIVGQAGPLVGTRIFPASDAPYYTKGKWICAGFLFFNFILAGCLRFWLKRQNLHQGELSGTAAGAETKGGDDSAVVGIATENYGVAFRYVL